MNVNFVLLEIKVVPI